jgi:electron transport complex protein RnfC
MINDGGTALLDFRDLSLKNSLVTSGLPKLAVLPLVQHGGVPYKALVSVAERVEEEQVVAKTKKGFPLHSPIPGKVLDFKNLKVPGYGDVLCLLIEMSGSFSYTGKKRQPRDWKKLEKKTLVNRLKQAGIIMMGGQKLSLVEALPKEGNLDWLIINTLQDQPFFSAQDEIIRSFGQELHQGILCLEAAVNPVRTIVAMEAAQMDRHEDFVSRLHKSGIKIKTYKRLYPQGDPRMVYEGVTGLALKPGYWPEDQNALVVCPQTVLDSYNAIVWNRPVTERVITISGPGISRPGCYKVKIGTSVGQVIKELGGVTEGFEELIHGGTLKGHKVENLASPVTKATQAYLALDKKNTDMEPEPCTSCGDCIEACPKGLYPIEMYNSIINGWEDETLEVDLSTCVDCGLCQFVCPSQIPLLDTIQAAQISRKKNGSKKRAGE